MTKRKISDKTFSLGKELSRLREEQNKKAEDIYSGICTKDEYWRYENGYRRPNWYTFEALLQRLNEDSRKYFFSYTTSIDDRKFIVLKNRLIYLIREKNPDSIKEAEDIIDELEQNDNFNSHKLNRIFLMRAKATHALFTKDYNTMYKRAFEGLKTTRADFDIEQISTYSLFMEEILLINLFAVACYHIESIEKSTEILKQLKACLDLRIVRDYFGDDENIQIYIQILYNLSKNCGNIKNYDESISLSDEGISICKNHRLWFHFPLFLINKGACLLLLGEKDAGTSLMTQARAFLNASERFDERSQMEFHCEKMFGIRFSSDNLQY